MVGLLWFDFLFDQGTRCHISEFVLGHVIYRCKFISARCLTERKKLEKKLFRRRQKSYLNDHNGWSLLILQLLRQAINRNAPIPSPNQISLMMGGFWSIKYDISISVR